jgi:carbon storage regulator
MLVLSRRQGESIVIGNDVRVTVVSVAGNQVKLSIEAPRSVPIYRSEVWEAIRKENEEALKTGIPAPEDVPPASALTDLSAGKGSFKKLITGKNKKDDKSPPSEESGSKSVKR